MCVCERERERERERENNGQDDVQRDEEQAMAPLEPQILYNGNQVQDEVVTAVDNTMEAGNRVRGPLMFRERGKERESERERALSLSFFLSLDRRLRLSTLSFSQRE